MRKRYKLLTIIGGIAASSLLFYPHSVFAEGSTPDNAPDIELHILEDQVVGSSLVQPSETTNGSSNYYIPITVKITNASQYSLSVSAAHSGLTDSTNTDNHTEISPVSGQTTLADMETMLSSSVPGVWGYRWQIQDEGHDYDNNYTGFASNYKPMSTGEGDTLIALSDANARLTGNETKTLYLDFGAVVGKDMPAGKYGNTVTITAVATPYETASFYTIRYMQDMTTAVCDSVPTPAVSATTYDTTGILNASYAPTATDAPYVPQRVLIDSRDNKTYIIRKLADGNCWMSQNLELDFTNQKGTYSTDTTNATPLTGTTFKLTSKDTDLNTISEWTPDGAGGAYSRYGIPAINVYQTQSVSGIAWGEANGSSGMYSFSSSATHPNDEQCSTANLSTTEASSFGFSACPSDGSENYRRFGNLYNWTAATLGSGLALTNASGGQEAPNSICPAGWRLPTNSNATGAKGYYNLLHTYLLSNNITGNQDFTSVTKVVENPLNFYRTGFYNYGNGNIDYLNTHGIWWSSTAYNATNSYGLDAYTNTVNAQNNGTRGSGGSLRCVARKSYTVTLDPNGGTNPEGAVTSLTGEQITLPSTNFPVKDGSPLWGWSTNPNATTPDVSPGNTILPTSNQTFYAIYGEPTMQLYTTTLCSALSEHATVRLIDERDNKKYTVKKMRDGHCWMVQNLALEGNTGSDKVITAYNASTKKTFNYSLPPSSSSHAWSNAGSKYMYNGNYRSDAPTTEYDTPYNGARPGAYYSWLVATAQDSNNNSNDGVNVDTSICPAGWKLPSSNRTTSTGDFTELWSYYTSEYNNFLNTYWRPGKWVGNYGNGSIRNQTTTSYWWSSTVQNSGFAYRMEINSDSGVNSASGWYRQDGLSVRCVFVGQ